MEKWWKNDWTEELVIMALCVIAIGIVLSWIPSDVTDTPGSEIVSGITGGLVGYLTRKKLNEI